MPTVSELIIGQNYTGFLFDRKFGFNPNLTTAAATIWDEGGIRSYIASATNLVVASSSQNDATAGTGLRTIELSGLDTASALLNETITLNQTSTTLTTNVFSRLFRIVGRSAGSGGENAGDVYAGVGTLTAGKPTTVHAKVIAGNNQTLMAVYSVPVGKRLYVVDWYANAGAGKGMAVNFLARPSGEVFQVKHKVNLFQNTYNEIFHVPYVFEAGTDLEVRATNASAGANVPIAAGFNFVMVDA